MNVDPAFWRVVASGMGRLHEVKYEWTIDELMDAHEWLDIKAEAEQHQMERARER